MKFKYIESKDSNKLDFDKYYTPYDTMKYCVDKTLDILYNKGYKINRYIEPSAGAGIFSDYLKNEKKLDGIAIDIEPENDNIIKTDFLTYKLFYEPNTLIIGNPPFGSKMHLAIKFYKRAIYFSDYISFILPIGQLNNINSLFDFNLIHSEDLGEIKFSDDRKVKCCLNIYTRPLNGFNKRPKYELKDVTFIRQDRKRYKDITDYDLRICYWGNATAGKILKENESYAGEYKIIINNLKLKDKIIDFFNTVDWKKELNHVAMLRIKISDIYNIITKYIPEIK